MNNLCLKAEVSASKQRLFIQKFVSPYLGFKDKVCNGRISENKKEKEAEVIKWEC